MSGRFAGRSVGVSMPNALKGFVGLLLLFLTFMLVSCPAFISPGGT
ncbi:MAG: hypothetical protein AAF460_15025 [Pseudomonadota bacterium]